MKTDDIQSVQFIEEIYADIEKNPDNWQYRSGNDYYIRRGYKFHSPDNYRVKMLVERIKNKYSHPYYNTKLTHAISPPAMKAINFMLGIDLKSKLIKHDQIDCVENLLYEVRRAGLDGLTIHSLVAYLNLFGKDNLRQKNINTTANSQEN